VDSDEEDEAALLAYDEELKAAAANPVCAVNSVY
jgi:hypothetical protein